MTVGELRKALEGVPDDAAVHVWDWDYDSPTAVKRVVLPGQPYSGYVLENDVVID